MQSKSGRDKSCESGEQRHESYRIVCLLADAASRFLDDGKQLHTLQLVVVACKRQHHATADLEVAQQRLGNLRRRRRDNDSVDLEILAQIGGAVAVLDADAVRLQRTQIAARLGDERADALNGVHLLGELRQDGGLVAAARTDLEN